MAYSLNQMISNSLTNVVQFPCQSHRRERITHICTDFRCSNSPYLCGSCFYEQSHRLLHGTHEESLLPIGESLPELAMIIEGSKVEMERLMASTIGKREHESLMKKVEQGDRHYMVVDSHIKNVKAQIEKETDKLLGDFQKRLQASKMVLFSQLDNYQRLYVQNMEAYRNIIEPLASFNKKYKYFSNPNNFSIKIFNEIKRKSSDWYVDLKRVMTLTTKIIDRPQVVYDNINRSTQYMTAACEELPHLRATDAEGKAGGLLQAAVNEVLNDIVVLKDLKPLSNYLVDSSDLGKIGNAREPPSNNRAPVRVTNRF